MNVRMLRGEYVIKVCFKQGGVTLFLACWGW